MVDSFQHNQTEASETIQLYVHDTKQQQQQQATHAQSESIQRDSRLDLVHDLELLNENNTRISKRDDDNNKRKRKTFAFKKGKHLKMKSANRKTHMKRAQLDSMIRANCKNQLLLNQIKKGNLI